MLNEEPLSNKVTFKIYNVLLLSIYTLTSLGTSSNCSLKQISNYPITRQQFRHRQMTFWSSNQDQNGEEWAAACVIALEIFSL